MSKKLIKSENLFQIEWPSTPTISPDGQQVVYEKTIARKEEDDYVTHLFLAESNGKSRMQLTSEGTVNIYPIWSPDGKTVAFLSNQSHGTQLWLLPLNGGKKRRLTNFKHGISSMVWSPDGEKIYALVPVESSCVPAVFEEGISSERAQEQSADETKQWVNGPKRYNWHHYKNDGAGLQTNRKRQIVAIDAATGAFQQLTEGKNDASEPAVSPDGKFISFITTPVEDNILFGGQIYRVPASGGEVEVLYCETKASTPSYSPDGKWIAFFSDHAHQKQLAVIPANGGLAKVVSREYDDTLFDWTITDVRYFTHPQRAQWSKDSKSILALGTREGRNEIIRFHVEHSGSAIVVGGDRAIFHFSFDGQNTVAAAYSTVEHPGKITAITLDENQTAECRVRNPEEEFSALEVALFPTREVRLDNSNDQFVEEFSVVKPEVFSYRSVDNWVVQGFILKPANFEEGKRYPVIVDIHGGPHGMFSFTYYHQLQVFAAQGYAVVFVNPRGSTGFGEEFTNAVHADYGGKDLEDILNGLDEVLNRYEFLDGERVAVNGLSYGGFMVNWIVTHTDRFFTAVSEGSICNWISMYGTSDIGTFFVGDELGGTDLETLWNFSPLAYVENVKTPLLLIHCENDLRCPIEQAEQFYAHIKKNGGETEFLRIPNSSHLLLQTGIPSLRIARLNAMTEFINDHKPAEVLQAN